MISPGQSAHSITLSRRLEKNVYYDKHLVDYPSFLLPPDTAPKGSIIKWFRIAPLTNSISPPGAGATVQAAGAALDATTATTAMVVAVAQVVVVVSTPGVPGPILVRAASETPQARVFEMTKVVTSSSGARATPLGPSAPRFQSNIALNTPPMVISAAIPTVL